METEVAWSVITRQRLAVADLLDGLSPAQWESPSLCSQRRIRDVAAHLTTVSAPPSPGAMLADLIRARGSFHRLNTLVARDRAGHPTGRIVADLREQAGSRQMPVVTNERNVLFDVLVHSQDIAIPLGIEVPVPLDAAAEGATRVWSMGWPFWAKRRLRRLRLVATDVAWSAGRGAEIRGPIRGLLLLVTGRTGAAAPLLSGDGVAHLAGIRAQPDRRRA